MKKILLVSTFTMLATGLFFALIILVIGCAPKKHYDSPKDDPHVYMEGGRYSSGSIIERTYRGDTHEFYILDRGICHWPDCKYCKKKKEEERLSRGLFSY